jgi:hypothetical protein
VKRGVVLMVVLGRIKACQLSELGDNRAVEHVSLIELRDIRLGNALLSFVSIENCRAVLCPDIRSLAVELGRVVRDGEIDTQNLSILNLARIDFDLD